MVDDARAPEDSGLRDDLLVLRDIKSRQGVVDNEISRRAYLYVARNHCLPAQLCYQAAAAYHGQKTLYGY